MKEAIRSNTSVPAGRAPRRLGRGSRHAIQMRKAIRACLAVGEAVVEAAKHLAAVSSAELAGVFVLEKADRGSTVALPRSPSLCLSLCLSLSLALSLSLSLSLPLALARSLALALAPAPVPAPLQTPAAPRGRGSSARRPGSFRSPAGRKGGAGGRRGEARCAVGGSRQGRDQARSRLEAVSPGSLGRSRSSLGTVLPARAAAARRRAGQSASRRPVRWRRQR